MLKIIDFNLFIRTEYTSLHPQVVQTSMGISHFAISYSIVYLRENGNGDCGFLMTVLDTFRKLIKLWLVRTHKTF